MRLIAIRSHKFGLYIRNQIIIDRQWVSVKGIAMIPLLQANGRRWWGLAILTEDDPPEHKPINYKKHGPWRKPKRIDYDPFHRDESFKYHTCGK